MKDKKWMPFEEARELARGLNLKSEKEWLEWARTESKPDAMPISPEYVYKGVRSLGIKNRDEWREYCQSGKKPADIPANPPLIYGNNKAY